MRSFAGITLLLALALGAGGSRCSRTDKPRIVGYFASWSIYARDYHVADIPAERLTHVSYAFAEVSNGGACVPGDPWADIEKPYPGDLPEEPIKGNFKQLRLLKEQYPHLRTLIAVGGWTGSSNFSDAAATPEARQHFAATCVAFLLTYGFDGIDIDWEFPVSGGLPGNTTRPEDRENYTLLLTELRAELDAAESANGRRYLLTIAAPADPWTSLNLELDAIHPYLDWIHLMTYDFRGGWSAETGFHAPLFADPQSGDEAVQGYLDAGVPRRKIVLGVPFYGRGWKGVPGANAGLYQTHSGVPAGTWEPGVFDFWDLAANYLPGIPRYWHEDAQAPWLYDDATGLMISYDDAASLDAKARYVRQARLAGVMAWELGGDDSSGTLLGALHAVLYW